MAYHLNKAPIMMRHGVEKAIENCFKKAKNLIIKQVCQLGMQIEDPSLEFWIKKPIWLAEMEWSLGQSKSQSPIFSANNYHEP